MVESSWPSDGSGCLHLGNLPSDGRRDPVGISKYQIVLLGAGKCLCSGATYWSCFRLSRTCLMSKMETRCANGALVGLVGAKDLLGIMENKFTRNAGHEPAIANFPLGLVPQKRPPQVPTYFIKCREQNYFWGTCGGLFW